MISSFIDASRVQTNSSYYWTDSRMVRSRPGWSTRLVIECSEVWRSERCRVFYLWPASLCWRRRSRPGIIHCVLCHTRGGGGGGGVNKHNLWFNWLNHVDVFRTSRCFDVQWRSWRESTSSGLRGTSAVNIHNINVDKEGRQTSETSAPPSNKKKIIIRAIFISTT